MIDREEYQKLDEKEQAKVFFVSSAADKGEMLMLSHDPSKLTQSLSEEELFLVLKEMDVEERSEIVKYANLSQLSFISDIECWNKDRMNLKGFVKWIETLQTADEQRLLAWLIYTDYATVVTGLKGIITVAKPDWEYASDEVLGDKAYFTFDERYYLYVEEESLTVIKRAMGILFENHRGRYAAILEGIISDMEDVTEEEAYRNREDRLADLGFPDTESANKIYRRLNKKEFYKTPKKDIHQDLKDNVLRRKTRPNYLALWSKDSLFLDQVLMLLKEDPPEYFDSLQEELVWLSNKVIAAEGVTFSSEEKVKEGIERARYFTSIGLELLSEGDLEVASSLIKDHWIEYIFRVGVTRLFELRDSAGDIVKTYWNAASKEFIEFLNRPYEFILRGALNRIPLHHDADMSVDLEPLSDFKSLPHVQAADKAVEQIRRIHEILEDQFHGLFKKYLNSDIGDQPQSLFSYLSTLFAHFILNGKLSVKGLSEKDAEEFLKKGFVNKGDRKYLHGDLKQEFLNKFLSEEDKNLLLPLWAFAFQDLEEELGALEKIDRRYVSALIFKEYSFDES